MGRSPWETVRVPIILGPHLIPGAPRASHPPPAPTPCRLTIWLAQGMENVQVHGPVQRADEERLVGTRGLVGSVDGLGLPVGPVDIILKQGQCKNVRDVLVQHCRQEGQVSSEAYWESPLPDPIALVRVPASAPDEVASRGHTATTWPSWNSNPGLSDSRLLHLNIVWCPVRKWGC